MTWTKPMQWKNEGAEPSNYLIENGFTVGYKPPAGILNYCINQNQVSIEDTQAFIDTKADSDHNHDDLYYNKSEMDTKLSEKVDITDYTGEEIIKKITPFYADAGHNHDDVYYTETEINTKLSEKVSKSDYTAETIAEMLGEISIDVSNADTLDGKDSSDFAPADHNHDGVYSTKADVDTKLSELVELLTVLDTESGSESGTDTVEFTESNIDDSDTEGWSSCVAYANGIWVACRNSGIYYSTDGKTWTQAYEGDGLHFSGLAYGDGLWITGEINSGGYYSNDGITWTATNDRYSVFNNVVYNDGLWVASANGGKPRGIYKSTDGINWTKAAGDSLTGANHVTYGSGLWVACFADSGIYYSTDGTNWTQSNQATGTFFVAEYGNGMWVAGQSWYQGTGGIYYSTDGINWTLSTGITEGDSVQWIKYEDGIFVACGGPSATNGVKGLWYSTDGMTWTQSNVTSSQFSCAVYGDGLWVSGLSLYDETDGIYYSTDGKTWAQTNLTTVGAGSVAYANNLWVINGGSYYYEVEEGPETCAVLPAGTSNTTVDVSSFITDTENYAYLLADIDTGGISVAAVLDQANGKAMFARGSGVAANKKILINFKILKVRVDIK